MRAARILPLILALATAAGCDLGGPRIEGTGARTGDTPEDRDDRFSILSRDGQVKLGLTDEIVYFRLSDEALEEADMEMAREEERQEGVAGVITSAVTGAVSRALRMRVSFDVDDIRSMRWDAGEFVLEFEDGEDGEERLDEIEVNNEDLLRKFDEDEVDDFIEAWEEVKGRG